MNGRYRVTVLAVELYDPLLIQHAIARAGGDGARQPTDLPASAQPICKTDVAISRRGRRRRPLLCGQSARSHTTLRHQLQTQLNRGVAKVAAQVSRQGPSQRARLDGSAGRRVRPCDGDTNETREIA